MATERPAKAKRILVVEDEPMIRMLLEDMLGELGYTVAAEAVRIEEALEATKNADFDLAILDADLNGQPASPVADGWAQANAAERARIAVVSSSFRVGDTWGREKGRREAEISAPLASYLE